MKKKILNIVLIVITLAICVASFFSIDKNEDVKNGERHDVSEYCINLDYIDNFRILQLNDIHFGEKDNLDEHFNILTKTINDAKPNLIVMNGDFLTYANKRVAKQLFNFIDSFGVPWTCTFGNHDEQCLFSIDWLTDYLNNYGSNCVFLDIKNDDVFGNSNFVINLNKDGKIHDQIILMDSNRYYFGNYIGYDYIKPSQIEWYERVIRDTTQTNGSKVSSVIFMHIPLPEFIDAWYEAGGEEVVKVLDQNGLLRDENSKTGLEGHTDYTSITSQLGNNETVFEYGYAEQYSCVPEYNSGLFEKIRELASTKAVIVAHDHTYNSRILYKGVYLCYGVNSTDRVIKDDNMIGGQVIIIRKDHSLWFEHVYHTYKELKND